MPPPPLGGAGGIMFLSVCPCDRPSLVLFLQCLRCALMDFYQTFVSSASWLKDELTVGLRVRNSKVKIPAMTKYHGFSYLGLACVFDDHSLPFVMNFLNFLKFCSLS